VKILDLTPLVTSLTSVYQLLPTFPCFDRGDGSALKRCSEAGAGIPNLDVQKAAAAFQFHTEIREAVEHNANDPEYKSHRYRIHPIVGSEQPTQQSARLDGGSVEMLESLSGSDDGGDGTVPRGSATPREELGEQIETFAPERHASLQNGDFALLNVKGWLSDQAIDKDKFKLAATALAGTRSVSLRLAIDDAYAVGQPVTLAVRPSEDWVELSARLSKADGTFVAEKPAVASPSGDRKVDLGALTPGIYRLTVSGSPEVAPVTDLFAVLGE
jgi:hypothetical protein